MTLIIIQYVSFQCLDGIKVSIEDRKGFIDCDIRRDKAIIIYWNELVEKEMLKS